MRQDIIGLDALANWGSPEVGSLGGGGVELASALPKSFVGIPPTAVPFGGGAVEIQVDVQREMRPDRLVISDNLNNGGDPEYAERRVLDVKVGTVSLNASPNAVPAEVFGHLAVGTSIRATMTAVPSIGIQITVQNTSVDTAWTVRGGFFGPSAAPGMSLGGPNVATRGIGAIVGAAEDPSETPEAGMSRDALALPQSFVGIPYTTLGDNVRTNIQVPIQRDIRPDRLIIPTLIGRRTQIDDIRVGTVSLNASMAPMPAEAFATLSFGTRLRATVTATPSVGIMLSVTKWDVTEGVDVFCGAVFGPSRYATT